MYMLPSTYGHHGTNVLRYSRRNSTMTAPRTPPSRVPGPPSTTISSASIEVVNVRSSGLTSLLTCAHNTPASPAKAPETIKTIYLCSHTL